MFFETTTMEYEEILSTLEEEYEGREAEVRYDDVFKVLVSTILSQRTKDSNTRRASKKLFAEYETAEQVAGAPLERLKELVKPAGFYNAKAKNIKRTAKKVVELGGVPRTMKELEELPGVGHKTAACTLVYGFGEPEIPVDVHVARITRRLGWTDKKPPSEVRSDLKKEIPRKWWLEVNRLFVKHGQKVCRSRNPHCKKCVVKQYCDYYERRVRSNNSSKKK